MRTTQENGRKLRGRANRHKPTQRLNLSLECIMWWVENPSIHSVTLCRYGFDPPSERVFSNRCDPNSLSVGNPWFCTRPRCTSGRRNSTGSPQKTLGKWCAGQLQSMPGWRQYGSRVSPKPSRDSNNSHCRNKCHDFQCESSNRSGWWQTGQW